MNLNISAEALAAALGPSAAMATSVSEVAGRPIDRNRFAASLLNRLERWHGLYTSYGPDAVRTAWNQRDALRGRLVEVRGGDTIEGDRVVGVDGSGRLILEPESGDTLIACGEVTRGRHSDHRGRSYRDLV